MHPTPNDATAAARRCAQALNSLHSLLYFTPDLAGELETFGIDDHTSIYLAGRASPLGAAGPELVTAAFNAFAPGLIAARLPALWGHITPRQAVAARQKAIGRALERLIGKEITTSRAMADAARLAAAAATAGALPGRPLYAANTAVEAPEEPHTALWHAATLLREHRGDGHIAVLGHAELTGIEALVIDCASGHGMSKDIVMPQRGWRQEEWSAAAERLADRGLVDVDGRLTARGTALRDTVERETGRLDRGPYAALGTARTGELAAFVHGLVNRAADAGAFPGPLRGFFAPATERWNRLGTATRKDRT
ncbi:hypothetical protein [Streptomyces sp. MP131-18]|uniref:SCO6745 family protein n=1 Tax=Streptomyces sp. MP131-18 TaxID=1857892 RepID=UPI00097C73D8|nr:hypothetical protein [Streptomyces sp. MP131-18]ONK09329.1 hypothetical protein STBA_00280 [Streptomyces sp. MP131-18]